MWQGVAYRFVGSLIDSRELPTGGQCRESLQGVRAGESVQRDSCLFVHKGCLLVYKGRLSVDGGQLIVGSHIERSMLSTSAPPRPHSDRGHLMLHYSSYQYGCVQADHSPYKCLTILWLPQFLTHPVQLSRVNVRFASSG